ncbi:MAG: MFS transporter [Clostridia bacterium]|nr:MFS transporter [Clostridia bacterium]
MKKRFKNMTASFRDIFSMKDNDSKGRSIHLSSHLLTTFYNVFVTGIFHTGFLSMYGMSITDTGVLTFIPYLCNLFSIFSSKILERFRKRKGILIASKIIYYALHIVATTAMPQFVHDPKARLICFSAIIFVAGAFYAPFAPGFTVWFYNFYPSENDRRTRFLVLLQTFASILSSSVLIMSAFLTDALEGSPYQEQLIVGFRYFAFVVVLIDVLIQSKAVEYPYPKVESVKLSDVVTLPFKYKKFILCMFMMFFWSYIGNLNNGLWGYHLLNHMNFSYTLINTMTVMYTVLLLVTSKMWQKMIRRYSWIKTFGIACLIWVPTEFLYFCMTPERTFMYVPLSVIQNILNVGFNFSYSNILYMNLPEENSTAHIAFNTAGCNICAFLGMMTGTWLSSISGDSTLNVFGMEIFSVQYTCIARGVLMLLLGLVLVIKWRSFTRQQDIEEVENIRLERKKAHQKA